MKTAKISEIFESIQGEGPYTGVKQVFIRFFGCGLDCVFCDTPLASFKEYTVEDLKKEVLQFKDYHSLCLTGGEPLLQADFIKEFLGACKDLKTRVYLETNGINARELRGLIGLIDIVAMDLKLPSSTARGAFWKEHLDFLKTASSKEVFIKIVVTQETHQEDILKAIALIKENKPDIAVVLQPNWFDAGPGLLEKMVSFQEEFFDSGIANVRILPQAHKYAGIK